MFFEDEHWSAKFVYSWKVAAEGQTRDIYFREYFKSAQPQKLSSLNI
jgi:hypothetical protein